MAALPDDDPRVAAFATYRESEEYENTRKWALHERHVDGSLWAAFIAGWHARSTGGDLVREDLLAEADAELEAEAAREEEDHRYSSGWEDG